MEDEKKNEEEIFSYIADAIKSARIGERRKRILPTTSSPYIINYYGESRMVYIGRVYDKLEVNTIVRDEAKGEIKVLKNPFIYRDVIIWLVFSEDTKSFLEAKFEGLNSDVTHPHAELSDGNICLGNLSLSNLTLDTNDAVNFERVFDDIKALLSKVSILSWFAPRIWQDFEYNPDVISGKRIDELVKSAKEIKHVYEEFNVSHIEVIKDKYGDEDGEQSRIKIGVIEDD